MITGFKKELIISIIITILLLGVCISVDYANNVSNKGNYTKIGINHTKINGTYYINTSNDSSMIVGSHKDKIHTVKSKEKKLPTISMWAKPSVRCGYPYRWYYRTFIDYCPNCHHYNCLLNNPKGVPENEYTCAICDSDFDGVVGKEKDSWSNVYLIKA